MKFDPTRESVDMHKIPEWYDNAKLGVFIHWSLFSVPAYAPILGGRDIQDLLGNEGLSETMKRNPYAEWYLNSLRIEGSPVQEYHYKNYGKDFSYFQFQKEFEEKSAGLNFNTWADFFCKSGAKYIVFVTKHHDGYCLWPSRYKNPFDNKYQSSRDIPAELSAAAKKHGIKMGLYYSGLYDWTFKKFPRTDELSNLKQSITTAEYARYATNHIYELIERYKPDVLWNDMGYPPGIDINKIFADYYNAVPEGVINDRWAQVNFCEEATDDELCAWLEKQKTEPLSQSMFKSGVHCDFVTPEYLEAEHIREKKFESTRGLGLSFGYNRLETEKETLTPEKLIHMLVDTASKNGNLLINVGPRADGTIPEIQQRPMLELGNWLARNGDTIYGTRPWKRAAGETVCGKQLRFLSKAGTIYAVILEGRAGGEITIKDFNLPAGWTAVSVESGKKITMQPAGTGIRLSVPDKTESAYATAFAFRSPSSV